MKRFCKTSAALLCTAALFSGCAVKSGSIEGLFNARTSYFDHLETEQKENTYLAKGELHISEDENTGILYVDAKDSIPVTVKGTMECIKGKASLVYISSDGTRTTVSELDEEEKRSIEESITIPDGEGIFKIVGYHSILSFDLAFEGLNKELVSSSGFQKELDTEETEKTREEEFDESIAGASEAVPLSSITGKFSGSFTGVREEKTIMEAVLEESTDIKLHAHIYVTNENKGPMTLGKFQLKYITSDGSEIPVIDHSGEEYAADGYTWEDRYSQKVTLPSGEAKLVLSSVEGENYIISLDISAE